MVDGKHVPQAGNCGRLLKGSRQDKAGNRHTEVDLVYQNGYGSDGTPYDMSTKYQLQPTAEFANQCFGESDAWDTGGFHGN